ncbi:MAG: hypothetical protein ACUVQ8_04595 [Nitrososphaeria archaeon]
MTDIVDKIKGERGLVERITSYLPGYHGYKEKELRRESDKMIREYTVRKLKEAKTLVNEAVREISDSGNINAYQNANRTLAVLDRVTSKVEHADYGYSGFFDAVKIREDKLDQLIEFDCKLVDLAESVKDAASSVIGQPDMSQSFDKFRKKVLEIESTLNNRENVIFEVSK